MPIIIEESAPVKTNLRYFTLSLAAALALTACAPSELKKPATETPAGQTSTAQTTATATATTATAAATTDTAGTGEEIPSNRTVQTGLIQFPEKPAPADFKLPFPDALAAVHMSETGKTGGSLTASVIGEPKTFDPITNNENSSSQVISQMFASLLGYDPDLQEYYPMMLKSHTVGEDQKTWTAKLRDGMQWSDGQPITADDIIFTAQVIFDKNIINPSADTLQVAGKPLEFKKVDNHTFTVIPAEPTGFMHVMLASFTPLPRHSLEPAYKAGQFNSAMNVNIAPDKLICSGPFKLQVYQPGERVVLVRNEHYFRADKNGQRLPYLDSMVFSIAPDLDSMMAKFRSGGADTLDSPRAELVPDLRVAQRAENFSLYDKGPGDTASFFWFNLKPGANAEGKPYVNLDLQAVFSNENLRKAV
jgi:peptide/nickel transport system substrate-binding protein